METDDEEIGVGIREQERDTRQVLFRSLVSNLPTDTILEYEMYEQLVHRESGIIQFCLMKVHIYVPVFS